MSLVDALLLDPAPFQVWIAYRTDGIKGCGTANDSCDGSLGVDCGAVAQGGGWLRCAMPAPNPKENMRICGTDPFQPIHLFANQTPSGGVLKAVAGRDGDELAARIEDSILMALL